MRFLVDENLSPKLASLLQNDGHDVVHVRNIGLASSTDQTVIDTARAEDRVLVSADSDFGTLLARSGATSPLVSAYSAGVRAPRHRATRPHPRQP